MTTPSATPAPEAEDVVLPALPDEIRVPLDELEADAGYLIGRAFLAGKADADKSTTDVLVKAIRGRCSAVRSVLVALRADQQPAWLPIESAPRTSKARLVWCPERQNIYVVCWRAAGDEPAGWVHFGGGGRELYEIPSHWMPLPAAPGSAHPASSSPAQPAEHAALHALLKHWREFGPEHGFDELIESLCKPSPGVCAVCGMGKHTAAHRPIVSGPRAGEPMDHAYVEPASAQPAVSDEALIDAFVKHNPQFHHGDLPGWLYCKDGDGHSTGLRSDWFASSLRHLIERNT